MASTLSSARDFSEHHPLPSAKIKRLAELEKHSGGHPTKTSSEPRPVSGIKLTNLDAKTHPAASLRKRRRRDLARFLIIFGMGVGTTLAWQSYGDQIREMIANSSPQLGWLAPQVALAETAPEAEPIAPTIASSERQQLEVMSISLAAMQQSIDQLTAHLVANQQQMASDNARLKQDILAKLNSAPRPVATPARKPVPVAPPQSVQESPER